MNVLHLNTSAGGGTGRTALNLSALLSERGHRSVVCCSDGIVPGGQAPPAWRLASTTKRALRSLLAQTVWKGSPQGESFIPDWRPGCPKPGRIIEAAGFQPDIVVAYWLGCFLTTRELAALQRATGAPVVWYMMDMAPFTGGCHYAFDCAGYISECGNCPAVKSTRASDVSSRTLARRRTDTEAMDITFVAASNHTADQCRKSAIGRDKRTEVIPIFVEPDVFRPAEKPPLRDKLGLPREATVLFFGAQSLTAVRKGMAELYQALEILAAHMDDAGVPRDSLFLAYAGGMIPQSVRLPFPVKHLGYLQGDLALAEAYQAADLFVSPSLEDSGPLMVNESVMCGTPVVSFQMGVAKDLALEGRTGFLAQLGDSSGLAAALQRFLGLDAEARRRMANECRSLAMRLLTPEAHVTAFENLFAELAG